MPKRRRAEAIAASAVAAVLALAPAPAARAAAEPASATASPAATATAVADPLTLRSPLCAPAARAALGAAQQRACARTGSPLTGAPTAHYAFDINWNPPITRPADVAVKSVYSLLDMLWLALLFAIRGALTLLDWAFSLNPFDLGATGGLDRALERFFAVIDAGYLSAVIAALGLWGIWSGLVRRRTPETLGGLAAAVAMLAAAIAVVHAPDRTAGLVARLANQAAMGLMAAPSRGVGAPPVATYGEAVDGLFDDVVRAPWCALQFRTRAFCDGAAERDAVKAALDAARDGDESPAGDLRGRVSRAELWLAFAPASDPRAALHDYYGGKDAGKVGALGVTIINTPLGDEEGHNPGEVAIQGAAGSLTRLPLLVLIALGVLGALLVIGWIALRLLDQAVTGFVVLLLTPVALLLVAFGEAGRSAFARWGLALLGALVSKVVYAVLLGVVVLAASLLSSGADAGNWLLAWLLQTAFWWSVFLKRQQFIAYLSVVPAFDGARPGRRLGALLAWRALGTRHGAASAPVAAVRGRALRARVARSEAVRAAAHEHLDQRADRRAAQHDHDAGDLLARDASLRGALDALTLAGPRSGPRPTHDADPSGPPTAVTTPAPSADRAVAPPVASAHGDAASAPPPAAPPTTTARPASAPSPSPETLSAERAALAPRLAAARESLQSPRHADERDRRRERLDQLRRELDLPAHDPRHAWRVGLSPDALLRQRDTDPAAHAAALRTIRAQLAADRAAMRALPTDPRTPPRPSVERAAAAHLDSTRLRELRREEQARLRHERARRRHLYR
jgi:hypothetical protein